MDQLTLIMPTGGRPRFLKRWLQYAANLAFPGPLVIVDDAGAESAEVSRELLRQFESRLHLQLIVREQRLDLMRKIGDALDVVTTPYAVLAADDDFFCPDGLQAAQQWLAQHSDYSIAHGTSVVFHLSDDQVHGPIDSIVPYAQATRDEHTASARLSAHLNAYTTTWYSVERTKDLRSHWQAAAELNVDLRWGEFVPSCLSVIAGRAHCLSDFYMARQGHPLRVSAGDAGREFEWVTNPKWSAQYHAVHQCLTNALATADQIAPESAGVIVQQALHTLIVRRLSRQLRKTSQPRRGEWLKKIPVFRQLGSAVLRLQERRNAQQLSARIDSMGFRRMRDCVENPG